MLESTGIEEEVDRLIAGRPETPVRLDAARIAALAARATTSTETEE
jgi:hypothetical protein